MAADGGQISKTIVEVYVETDSESEPYSSSEAEDGSEATLTAQEGELGEGVLGENPSQHSGEQAEVVVEKEAVPPDTDLTTRQLSPPPIMPSAGTISPCLQFV